jgi:hypothetical protein
VMGSCEHGNEAMDSINGGEFLDQMFDSFSKKFCSVELVS